MCRDLDGWPGPAVFRDRQNQGLTILIETLNMSDLDSWGMAGPIRLTEVRTCSSTRGAESQGTSEVRMACTNNIMILLSITCSNFWSLRNFPRAEACRFRMRLECPLSREARAASPDIMDLGVLEMEG